MADQLFTAEAFRSAVGDALKRAGELLVIVAYAQAGGEKSWYLVRTVEELDAIFAQVPATGRAGRSDRIKVYATEEFPHRAPVTSGELQATAIDVLAALAQNEGVMLALWSEGDPELHHVVEAESVTDIVEWFSDAASGLGLVGLHPYRHDHEPDGKVFVAYNASSDGTIRPGAY